MGDRGPGGWAGSLGFLLKAGIGLGKGSIAGKNVKKWDCVLRFACGCAGEWVGKARVRDPKSSRGMGGRGGDMRPIGERGNKAWGLAPSQRACECCSAWMEVGG